MDPTTQSAIAFCLGVILATIRIFEFFRDRFRLSVVTCLRGDERHGNDVVLLNASALPVNIYHFELVWARRRFGLPTWLWKRAGETEFSLDDSFCDITVAPRSQHLLNFSEGDHFNWGGDMQEELFLKLWVIGRRKPLWRRVVKPYRYRNTRRRAEEQSRVPAE